jgi:hypothetical protein
MPLVPRFWAHVEKTETCWLWTGYRNNKGYGQVNLGSGTGKLTLAHRLSYEIHHGPIPIGLWVRHTCDTPPCVSPAHLVLGTPADNTHDMMERGRNRPVHLRGERSGTAKLTEALIREARELVRGGMTHSAVATRFGLHKTTISKALAGTNWAHLA